MVNSSPDYVTDLVRRQDRDRFITAMFAPAQDRGRLLALYAFNLELARIPSTVSEPMLGQIRLQWWRDLIHSLAQGGAPPPGHPVSQALAPLVSSATMPELLAMVAAREEELGGKPTEALEAASASLSEMALGILGVEDAVSRTAARHAAMALDLASRGEQSARTHIEAARSVGDTVDRRALPVLLWTTIADARLRRPGAPLPMVRLLWNAWCGRY